MQVVTPNGGTVYHPGESVSITWNAPAGAEKYSLSYTTNNGVSWTQASNGLTELSVFSFATSGTNLFAGAEIEHVARQTRPNPNDFVTGSYTLTNFDLGVERNMLGRAMRFEVGVRNAANVRYRSFLSRYKEFALEPGRNIIIRISSDR